MERVYLDMCSLKRPFDDQRLPRVREEATAVSAIIGRAEAGEIELVRSPAHLVENDATPREDRQLAAAFWIDAVGVDVRLDGEVEIRAAALVKWGFRRLDALHVAFAERAGARCSATSPSTRRSHAPGRSRAAKRHSGWRAVPPEVERALEIARLPSRGSRPSSPISHEARATIR